MRKKHWSVLGPALGILVLGVLVGLMTVGTVAADPTPGVKIQIPRIDIGEGITLGEGEWKTWIQAQNVGDDETGAVFLGWGEYSGLCPTNDPGIIAHYCELIPENALWTLRSQIDESVKSGIMYSVDKDLFVAACSAAELTEGDTDAWRCWIEEWEFGTCEGTGGGWADPPGAQGEDLAVTVTRYGDNDYDTFVSSTYVGISEEMEGQDPPYEYYAPYVMKGYNGLDTELTIQNSGEVCTSVWIDYKQEGTCTTIYTQHIQQLAPGESIRLKVPCNVGEIPCYWLGSAYITAGVPLGIVVDQTSFEEPCLELIDRGTLLTHRARPKIEVREGEVVEDTLVYADLIFREWSGWNASIQVQNLSRTGQRTFVTVDFLDNSGDEILFLADWVCPGDSETFYLPVVTDLGYDYVGAAEIESHSQVDFPGGNTPAAPIFAVVDLKKPVNPEVGWMYAQGGSYNAHPYSQKEWVSEIALPFVVKDADDMWTSMIAIRNNSNCNKIRPKIEFYDENANLVCELNAFWLRPKHVTMIDLNNIGCLYPGWVGAGKVTLTDWEQLCDVDNDGHAENEPLMPSVIVVEKGVLGTILTGGLDASASDVTAYGDITNVYEGIPYATYIPPCYGDIMGKVHSIDPGEDVLVDAAEPIQGVTVLVSNTIASQFVSDITNSTGDYEVEDAVAGLNWVSFFEPGFLPPYNYWPYFTFTDLDCGEDEVVDAELLCLGDVGFRVVTSVLTDTETSIAPSALVTYTKPFGDRAAHYAVAYLDDYYRTSGETDNTGVLTLTVPILDETGTFTVTSDFAETGVFTWTQMTNDPARVPGDDSIFAFEDSQILNGDVGPLPPATFENSGAWSGFDDESCVNIGGEYVGLNNQDVELVLCGYGTIAGQVMVGGLAVTDELVEVLMNGEVVGQGYTGPTGTYIIGELPTGCFSTDCTVPGAAPYTVRVMGSTQNGLYWDGCGDVERVDFHF